MREKELTAGPKDPALLEEAIGYRFRDRALLFEALTHSSFSHERPRLHGKCNERLEFLGDSVLSLLVGEYLFETCRDLPEGGLTKLRASLVQSSTLASFAASFSLGDYLLLGNGEEKTGGRERPTILENAFEALLGAIYLDADPNGKETVEKFLLPFVKEKLPEYLTTLRQTGVKGDYKTQLQQFIQQADGDPLTYELVSEEGPDHAKTFTCVAMLGRNVIGKGTGPTIKKAEQGAALDALRLFGETE